MRITPIKKIFLTSLIYLKDIVLYFFLILQENIFHLKNSARDTNK
jgi:hypothetical protein